MTVWAFLLAEIEKQRPVALVSVVAHEGSTPGKQGFRLAVPMEGTCYGTVGGGIMEFNLIDELRESLQNGMFASQLLLKVHRKTGPLTQQSGMICAGQQTMTVHFLQAADRDLLASLAVGEQQTLRHTATGLVGHDGEPAINQLEGSDWCYEERVNMRDKVHIIGGGHVGLALSRVLGLLDLDIHVYDDREDLDTMAQISCGKTVVPYSQLGELIEEDQYVVIVTTSAVKDAEALAQVIEKRLAYVGLMGSAAKIAFIKKTLLAQGFSSEAFKKVKAPVGLEINSRTPAEIGVSISAEIVKCRNC